MRKAVKSLKTSVKKLFKKNRADTTTPAPAATSRQSMPARSSRSPPSASEDIRCEPSAFQMLPQNVLHSIADKLPRHSDQARLARTCRAARDVVNAKLKHEEPVTLDARRRADIEFIKFLQDKRTLLILTYVYGRIPEFRYFTAHHFDMESKKYTKSLQVGKLDALSDNHIFAVSISGERTLNVFDLREGTKVNQVNLQHAIKSHDAVRVSNNGTVAVLLQIPLSELPEDERDAVSISDERKGRTYRVGIIHPHGTTVTRLEHPPNGGFIFFTAPNGIEYLQISPNGQYVVSLVSSINTDPFGRPSNHIWVWNTSSGAHIATIQSPSSHCILPSPDNKTVFIDGCLYSLLTGRKLGGSFYEVGNRTYEFKLSNGLQVEQSYHDAAFSPNGDLVYVPFRGMICLCDLKSGRLIIHKRFLPTFPEPFTGDGQYYSMVSDNIVHIVRSSDHKLVKQVHVPEIAGCTFHEKSLVSWEMREQEEQPRRHVIKEWALQPRRPSIPPMPSHKPSSGSPPKEPSPKTSAAIHAESAAGGGRRRGHRKTVKPSSPNTPPPKPRMHKCKTSHASM